MQLALDTGYRLAIESYLCCEGLAAILFGIFQKKLSRGAMGPETHPKLEMRPGYIAMTDLLRIVPKVRGSVPSP